MSDAAEVVGRFYAAEADYMNAGGASTGADFAAMAATLDPDVVLHQSPDLPWGGTFHGHAGYEDWARAMSDAFDRLEVKERRFFAQAGTAAGDTVVVTCRLVTRSRATGEVLDLPMAQLVSVRDGRIVEFRPFYWNVPAYRAAVREPSMSAGAPHASFWAGTPARTVRRGHFWIAGERVGREGRTYQRGPMFVEWEAPEAVTRPYPVILVHGGGFQGTEWFDTPDGRPGWAQRLVEAGYATLVVDRPGHGRSPLHPDIVGPPGPSFSYEGGRQIYAPPDPSGAHAQWPFDLDDAAAWDQFIAGYGPLPADLAASEDMDADRLARLLDRIGPAILLTHSASGPSGWLGADRRPGLVKAIVSVEPMGPPFADIPNIGPLRWGLTAVPLTFDPPRATPEEVRAADPATLRLPNLAGLAIAVVTGDTSSFAPASPPIVAALKAGGAAAELLHLPDHGVTGSGHGLIYETNSDAALKPVLDWLQRHAGTPPHHAAGEAPVSRRPSAVYKENGQG